MLGAASTNANRLQIGGSFIPNGMMGINGGVIAVLCGHIVDILNGKVGNVMPEEITPSERINLEYVDSKFKEKLDNMSLYEMFYEWRNAPLNSFLPRNARTIYFLDKLFGARKENPAAWDAVSKLVGFGRKDDETKAGSRL